MFLDLLAEQPYSTSGGTMVEPADASGSLSGGGAPAAASAAAGGEGWRIYYAFKGELPTDEELAGLRGVVITGSV